MQKKFVLLKMDKCFTKIRRFTAILCPLMILFVASFTSYASKTVVLDVSRNPVYQNEMADTVIEAYTANKDAAKQQFDGKNLMLLARLDEIGKKNKSFTVVGVNKGAGKLTCSADSAIDGLSQLKPGDLIQVYGKVKISTWMDGALEMKVKKVSAAAISKAKNTVFSLLDGASIESSTMQKRSIADGKFQYAIPQSFSRVEYELPNVPGYQYKLNELDGNGTAESLFVFYVDEHLLQDRGDITKTTQVQKAIILDILNGVKIRHKRTPFLARDIDMVTLNTDYASFQNYSGNYTDPNKNNYRVEFMFLPSENRKDVRCLLYVYQKENHLDDILFLMRNMDI